MAAIKLFGATITVKGQVKVDEDHGHDHAMSKTPATSSSSSFSDQGMEGDRTKNPDMIIPCPRCKSIQTKFCYFNNYNVNQPRYLCKGCHRYWTDGGVLRNVPAGVGRRKTRHTPSTLHTPCVATRFTATASTIVVGIKNRRVGFDCAYDPCG